MTKDPQHILVCQLLDAQEMRGVAQSALEESVSLVSLTEAPPEEEFVLELHAPGARPVVVMASSDGKHLGDMYAVRLRAMDDEHYGQLLAYVCISESTQAAPLTRWSQEIVRRPSELRLDTLPEDSVDREFVPTGSVAGTQADPLIGRTLAGDKYRIESLLGEGSAGAVYRCRHLALDKELAIKVLHPRFRADATFSKRFHAEARAASRLDHPNVTRVQDFGEEPDGLLYIVMELLNGVDLRTLLQKKSVPLARKIDILMSVLSALAAADDQGIVHRDIKPENVLVVASQNDDGDRVDTVKVCDFGLATVKPRSTGGTDIRQAAAAMSWVAGTPEYMSPEQILGENLDIRSDLYACGIMLYEMLVGKLPFQNESVMHIMKAQLYDEPERLRPQDPTIDPGLERLVMRALSKDRASRPSNPREFRNELRSVLKAQRSQTTDGSLSPQPAPSQPPAARRPDTLPPPMMTVEKVVGDVRGALLELRSAWKTTRALSILPVLGEAIEPLLKRGDFAQLSLLATLLARIASQPSPQRDERHDLGVRALAPLRSDSNLAVIAGALLSGPTAHQEAVRDLLVLVGPEGAKALVHARRQLGRHAIHRDGFAQCLRSFGEVGVSSIVEILDFVIREPRGGDLSILEDALAALTEESAAGLQPYLQKLVHHGAPYVRRATLVRLPAIGGAGARAMLRTASRDPDDSVRIAAIEGLRAIGGIDGAVVGLARDLLTVDDETSSMLRAAVAASLADVVAEQRSEAIMVLRLALRPRSRSLMNVLRQSSGNGEEPEVLEAVARSLVTIAGADGVRDVQRRVDVSKGELRTRLESVLRERDR